MSKSSLQGHTGVHFGVKGWGPIIDRDICEELENQKVFVDHKVHKKKFLI